MKLAIVTLVGILSCAAGSARADEGNAAASQETTLASDSAEAPLLAQATPDAAEPAAEVPAATPAADASQPQPAAQPEAESQPQPAPANAETTATVQTNAEAEVESSINPSPAPTAIPLGDVIPLIQFQEVSLSTAIENLARQANINYILDPAVGFGQRDERGNEIPQPVITIRWENVSPGQALLALLQNYGLQLVDDPKTKIARVTKKDPKAPDPLVTRTIQLKFASPSNILAAVQTAFTDRRSKVVADVRTSQLVVLATEKELEAIDTLITRLDTQTRQVLIEAKLIETTLNPSTMKGIDWSGTLQAQTFRFGNNALAGTPPSSTPILDPGGSGTVIGVQNDPGTIGGILGNPGLLANTASGASPATFFLNSDGVSAVLSFLNQYAEGRVVSAPRTVTLDNEKATIAVGQLYPIVNVSPGTANTPGGSQINYSNLTVNLDVTPRITANNYVNLKVRPSIMRLGPRIITTVAGQQNAIDSFLTRNMETTVLIPSGNTLVMGGLMNDETRTQNVKVPLLGDIPILGLAFRHDAKSRDKNNLVVFITPTVVTDSDFTPTATTFLKTEDPTKNKEGDKEWSAWDSGKPYDWSKLNQ